MNTIVSDWQIVSVMDKDEHIGDVLWATCVEDMTFRFFKGDYICTSRIIESRSNSQLIRTHSGSLYQTLGDGKHSVIQLRDFELLRNGFSPQVIQQLNDHTGQIIH
ncbi:hypothetical protein [Litorilituus sediminis]|uniref:Uncharacterized protein n=1 Tax=Litorilituus sediminis TaxID=718192 RepID=A0A4P6PAB4_9GAMM|nr:hypothetical protein [Litorilituus sediminis]QBG37259.1 hypothetical protein EMK97_16715 [Litorilituus sediminis]